MDYLLVLEIAQTSQARDREKARDYATAEVPTGEEPVKSALCLGPCPSPQSSAQTGKRSITAP